LPAAARSYVEESGIILNFFNKLGPFFVLAIVDSQSGTNANRSE
jgi:hypothetical protein